jgi:hypothetical protein
MNIFYIIGVVVVIILVAGYFGFHAFKQNNPMHASGFRKAPRTR